MAKKKTITKKPAPEQHGVELIISEKPSAAKRIAESLADSKAIKKIEKGVSYYELTHDKKDIIVVSAVGHLYTVAEKKKSFTYPSFDIIWTPTHEVSKDADFSKKYLDVITKLAKNADTVTVACDYDVEGEVIGFNCVRFACKKKDAKRMKFSTLTKEDLIEAYENAEGTIDWGLAHAGETRHFLDWMYGINISRALTLAIKSTGSFKILSTGRVQGPALKILYEKERTIDDFKPEPYWQILLEIEKSGTIIDAMHELDKFTDKAEAKKRYEKANGKKAVIENIEKKESKVNPPTPFDLGTLQTESYKLFGIKPKDTLSIAQNLYTSGVISYPRTSSQKLPAKLGYKKILSALAKNENYTAMASRVMAFPKLVPNEGKKEDPAHPAIYPTGIKPTKLGDRDAKLYDLIVKRFFAIFGEAAIRESLNLTIDCGGEKFLASGMTTKEKNWFELYEPYAKFKEEEWPAFSKNEELKVHKLELQDKQTSPPKRYTPASIITELEKRGLGTKSTRAEIVESLYSRKYIIDESIKVTDIGKRIVEILSKYCPKILDDELTHKFELDMEEIMARKKQEDEVLKEAREILNHILSDFKSKEKAIGTELKDANRETQDKESFMAKCPVCKEGNLRLIFSKKRKRFIACDKYPDCKTSYPVPQTGGIKATGQSCKHCSQPTILVIRKRSRPQEVCINMECPSKKIEGETIETPSGKEQSGPAKVGRACPKCGKDLLMRSSIYGKFIGCSGYPKCRHTENINKPEEAPK